MDLARQSPLWSTWLCKAARGAPVAVCFCILALLFIAFHAFGLQLNGDFDDLLKLVEIRHLLETGDVYDRTLPGIAQPEPYTTHWPWLVDLPYAAVATPLSLLLGQEAALAMARFWVPLLLLLPALFALHRLILAAGFKHGWAVLPIAAILSMRSLFEFAPGRIDYHNVQIALLLWSLALLLPEGRSAALINGALAALALAISLEFALFYALVLAVVAWDFVVGRDPDGERIRAFGAGLAVAALALYAIIVPPGAYGGVRCDSYSMPQLAALGLAGLSFMAVPFFRGSFGLRLGVLAAMAAGAAALLYHLYPQCLGGPYTGVSDYVIHNQLDRIDQEKSLLGRPDFVLSGSAASMAVLFSGALALVVIAAMERGASRARLILALFALLALLQAIAYFRYFRYLPLFSGIGLVFVLSAALPPRTRFAGLVQSDVTGRLPPAGWLLLPGVALSVLFIGYHLVVATQAGSAPAAEIADICASEAKADYRWPPGARVLSPPLTGLQILSRPSSPSVVAVPNHPAWPGIERAYRFLDPQTVDPRAILDLTGATHVAICAWRRPVVPAMAERYPFAAALMEGGPPAWLSPCPTDGPSDFRIYAYDGAACPTRLP